MKKNINKAAYILILIAPVLYAMISIGVAAFVKNNGLYPSGSDTMCHIYKGDVLYRALCDGVFWPAYDALWYNGVEMLRYWAPLPVYVLAGCQALGGGDPMNGYIVFVGMICFLGGLSWLYIGFKVGRPLFGTLLGIFWFFMPNNLMAMFTEGNLPRSVCMIFLPLLMFWVYDYLQQPRWQTLPKLSVCFLLIALCHSGYAGMILISFLLYLIFYMFLFGKRRHALEALTAMILGYTMSGIWLVPSLIGGIASMDSSEVMAGFFQKFSSSINPFIRLERGCIDFYFGLAAFLLAVFGVVMSHKKSMPGFWTGILLLLLTTNTAYTFLAVMPGAQFLWMLRFISIALCMILFSFLIWDSLKKGWALLFLVLLALDMIPSMGLILGNQDGTTAYQRMDEFLDWSLLGTAKAAAQQRIALIETNALESTAPYLISDYKGYNATSFGAGYQSSTTAKNITQLNIAIESGSYLYLFDRCKELGNDTVLIRISSIKDLKETPLEQMDEAAGRTGYRLIADNGDYRVYQLDQPGTWGHISKYRAIGIGTAAPGIAINFPAVEETESTNLNDYTFEELSKYDVIYLSGFTYEDKPAAEKLVQDLSEAGVYIIMMADGIPEDRISRSQNFLGVNCQSVQFSQGYPILYTIDGELDPDLFPDGYREWNTVFVNGLDQVWGTIREKDVELPFYGTVKNDHIRVIGLNLTYYYGLTRDKGVGKLLSHVLTLSGQELPERELVPYQVNFTSNEIVIHADKDNLNTTLAFHDSFRCDREIISRNHLTYVNQGETRIRVIYPYLAQGCAVTGVSILILILHTIGAAVLLRKEKGRQTDG